MVDLQSTNRVKISSVRETTFGVIPTSPAFKTRRVTSHALATNPQTVVSSEIRSDRQRRDVILTAIQPGGQVGGEAAFQVMDDDLEEALQGTWSVTPTRDNAGTADSVITAVTASGEAVTHTTGAAFAVGHLVLFSGFGQSANNGRFRCTTGGTTSSDYSGASFVDESAPAANAKMKVIGFQGVSGDLVISGSTMTSTTLDFTTLGLVAGQWLRIDGFVTTADNDFVRVSAIAAHTLTFDRTPAGWADDAGTSKVISVYMGDVLTNGSTKRSRTWERQYLDHSPVTYEYLPGEVVDKLTMKVTAAQIATYTLDFVGGGQSTDTTTRASGATDTAAPDNDVLNAAANVGRIGVDGSAVSGPSYVMDATIEVANNLRRQVAIGSIAPVGIGNGEFAVTLTLNTYFGDKSLLDKLLANTLTSFDLRIGRTDSNNESYVLDFPSVKFQSGSPSVSGKNADVMLQLGAAAVVDDTLGYTMAVNRFYYLP
jgi:hypothetical protein